MARGELFLAGSQAGILSFAPLPSAEATKQYAIQLRGKTDREIAMVLYERHVPRNEFTRRVLTRDVLVRLTHSADAGEICTRLALTCPGTEKAKLQLRDWHLFRASAFEGAFELREHLRSFPEVVFAEVQLSALHQAKFIPDDTLFTSQWHLLNTGQNGGIAGLDLEVTNVWNSWRGTGQLIGVVDNGIEAIHPDLAPNMAEALATNLNNNAFSTNLDRHGTAVAGLIGARGNNGVGVAGVAFDSRLVDIRLLGDAATDAQDAVAMLYANDEIHIKNNSWGAADGTGTLDGAGPLMADALFEATSSGRGGLGTIFVFAGGNGRAYGENVNYDGYANSACVITVGAITDQGDPAPYSEPGACLAVSAPSGSGVKLCSAGRQSLTTTDLLDSAGYNYTGAFCELSSPDYTQSFSGTSGATALVSGVVGLMLEANPALGWRDVKEILMRSARKVLPLDTDWQTNYAGISHNHRCGAGLVSARGAVALSTQWFPLRPLATISQGETGLNMAVPDNDATGLVRAITFTNAGFRVETVALHLVLPHEQFGDLAITLTSPGGTVSRLAERHNSYGSGYNDWTFTSVRHWGEPGRGVWTLRLADLSPTKTGALQAIKLDLFGSEPEAHLDISRTNAAWRLSLTAAAPGWSYALESSTNLSQWVPVTSLRIPETGRALVEVPADATSTIFYRARLPGQ